jgi:hypothetical protein
MKYLKISLPQYGSKDQEFYNIPIFDYDKKFYTDGYSVVGDAHLVVSRGATSQNRLREMIAILLKHAPYGRWDRGISNLNLAIMKREDGQGYRLMTRSDSWAGRSSYYAGIIKAVEGIRRRCRKRKKKQVA